MPGIAARKLVKERHKAVRSTSMADKYFDTEKMVEIILFLIENSGSGRMIKGMIKYLIRNESDNVVPSRKSTGVLELEKKYGIPLAGLTRNQIYPKSKEMSDDIVIEHGLPIGQALDMCLENQNKKDIKFVLKEIKDNLVYITKSEDDSLKSKVSSHTPRSKGPFGFYWEEAYGTCGIKLVDNTKPKGHGPTHGPMAGKDYSKYIFMGKEYGKRRSVQAVITKYIKDHYHTITLEDLQREFPKKYFEVNKFPGGDIEVIDTYSNVVKKGIEKRYFMDDPITLNSGEKIVICVEWGITNIDKFLSKAKALGFSIKKKEQTDL
jgi:hypothetical protein